MQDSKKVPVWKKGDTDGFFGLFTNNLTNLLVMAGLLSISLGMPAAIVYGRILPAVGLSIFISSMIYTLMAWRLARREQRAGVTALPSGTSVPHMFLIVFLIMGPVYWETGDPMIAWYAGLAWCFIEGIIELFGSAIGPKVKEILPRAAMLGTLAGVSITFIAMTPAMQTFHLPYIGLISLVLILLNFYGKVPMPFRVPVGLIAIVIGTIIGWSVGDMDAAALRESMQTMQASIPLWSADGIIEGFSVAAPFLISAIPLGIYNFFETIDNIESASVAGDEYPVRGALLADGSTTVIASLFGSPFPTAVYIGHGGWKEVGAGVGYTWSTGLAVLAITWLGVIPVLLELIPLAAIVPILIYIGLFIGSQAFQSTPSHHAPAVILAILPWLADWARGLIDTALDEAGTTAGEIGYKTLETAGLEYAGMTAFGSGAILIGMLWSTVLVFIIERQLLKAAAGLILGSALSLIGIIHTEAAGWLAGPEMALSYAVIAVMMLGFHISEQRREKLKED
ncbi:xanthine permease [Salisediminibacterium halotolerans]|uniref:MFS transporter, AGZA family, xanthine/uracil permease n=1 Tax=Salisediminibacterium halotolerans TaxID=517425 RepID=A0A1H9W3S3_9BACI|nr:xanthine permease [Salisediminibacterium haloalkalitolerans]SES28586.1 putative MFS transporter, AGZA family, xanthine/uracil permease [Salisediminibacterium haloalkalitolerans]